MGWSVHHPHGLIYYAPQYCHRGYTLFANLRGYHASLIDMQGRICHRWHWEEGINYARLLPNGNLLLHTHAPRDPGGTEELGGAAAAILELDWEGTLVWEYRNPLLHHDFQRLPNGNTIALLWELIPSELTAQVRGGYRADDDPERMLGDLVREVTPAGQVVFNWRSWEHLSVEEDVICALKGRREWTHGNSLGATPQGDLLVSFRQTSTIGIVDRASGAFSWKWGPGEISHQHHPTWTTDGRVLLFDNGSHRRAPSTNYSRVIEVDPATNQIAWEYRGDPPISFYSYQTSGAQRLPNGNTLICEGAPGRIFEVTPSHQIIWEYINPFFAPSGRVVGGSVSGQANSLFRAYRYGSEFPGLQDKDLVLSQLGFGNCLRKRLRLLPFFRSVDVGGWQPWDENGMWSGWKGKNETCWND